MARITLRDLFYAALAANPYYVGKKDIVPSLNKWVESSAGSFDEFMAESGFLDETDRKTIDCAVEKCLSVVEKADVTKVAPTAANSLDDILSTGVTSEFPEATGGDGGASLDNAIVYQHYDELKFHASGGLGTICIGKDRSLKREVALKQMKPSLAAKSRSRERFLFEAKVTGRLEHPGIVPVYGMGTDQNDRPFYAMRLVRGKELRESILNYHQNKSADQSARNVAFRELLGRFVNVCNAIGFAHRQGLIHRDIKPTNIMLGEFGETLVIDWGLARVLSQPHRDVDSGQFGFGAKDAPTLQGEVVGTPGYMSPEQAKGNLSELKEQSDIYSLGILLYEIICGKNPFKAETQKETFKNNQKSLIDIKTIEDAPPALAAVCLKAMHRDPGQRYESVIAMSEDVERWLADEPVTAWQEPVVAKCGRWLRNHQTLMATIAASILVATLGLTIGIFVVANKNNRLSDLNSQVIQAKDVAQRNLDTAQTAVSDFFTEVSQSEELLLGTLGTDRLRSRLLKRAQDYYQQLVQDNERSNAKQEMAKALTQLGRVRAEMSELDLARKDLEKSTRQLSELSAISMSDQDLYFHLTIALSELGSVEADLLNLESAAEKFNQANKILQELLKEFPNESSYVFANATLQRQIGNLMVKRGASSEKALRSYEKSLQLSRQLITALPSHEPYLRSLASTLGAMASLSRDTADFDKSFNYGIDARDTWRKISQNGTPDQMSLANCLTDLGALLREQGELEQSMSTFKESSRIWGDIIRDSKVAPNIRFGFSTSLNNIGRGHLDLNQNDDAIRILEQSREISAELVESYPVDAKYRIGLVGTGVNLAHAYRRIGRHKDATKILEESLESSDVAVNSNQTVPKYRERRAGVLAMLALVLTEQDRLEEGMKNYDQALEDWQQLIDAYPDRSDYQVGFATTCQNIAVAHKNASEFTESLEANNKALTRWRILVDRNDAHPPYLRGLGDVLNNLGRLYNQMKMSSKAEEFLQEAIQVYSRLTNSEAALLGDQGSLAKATDNLADLLLTTDRERAADLLMDTRILWKKLYEQRSEVPEFVEGLASNHYLMFELHKANQKGQETLDELNAAIELQDELVKSNPAIGIYRFRLSNYLSTAAIIYATFNRAKAQDYSKRAAVAGKSLLDKTEDSLFLLRQAANYSILAAMCHESGDALDAIEAYEGGMVCWKKLSADDARWKNNYALVLHLNAWILAPDPDPSVRDGKRAVELAEQACELSGWTNSEMIGTLAAAYAETGDFEKAVDFQLQAISVTPERKRAFLEETLEKFKAETPYRDTRYSKYKQDE